MQRILLVGCLFLAVLVNMPLQAEGGAKDCMQNNLHKALSCYLAHDDKIENAFELLASQYDKADGVKILTYRLTSQRWPHGVKELLNDNLWQHTVKIYQPNKVRWSSALLYINGGTRHALKEDGKAEKSDSSPLDKSEMIQFSKIAASTGTIVVDLQDVPNQYLHFEDDSTPRKEDGLIAYSYNKVLENPLENAYWAGHLPMVKSAVKAMNAVQALYQADQDVLTPKDFVVAGSSKRGWTAWLTALADSRVRALVPIVIDTLNTLENMRHIEKTYAGKWPPALHDYESQGVLDKLDLVEMQHLLRIEDPLSYLGCEDCDAYQARYEIPKYIVNASGDDFFLPDSSKFYFSRLPGENLLRYVPNSPHFIDKTLVSEVLEAFFLTELEKQVRPKFSWQLHQDKIAIYADRKPSKLTLWVANNEQARDFRFNAYPDNQGNIRFQPHAIPFVWKDASKRMEVSLPKALKGWQAAFVEATFEMKDSPLILTTEVAISKAGAL